MDSTPVSVRRGGCVVPREHKSRYQILPVLPVPSPRRTLLSGCVVYILRVSMCLVMLG